MMLNNSMSLSVRANSTFASVTGKGSVTGEGSVTCLNVIVNRTINTLLCFSFRHYTLVEGIGNRSSGSNHCSSHRGHSPDHHLLLLLLWLLWQLPPFHRWPDGHDRTGCSTQPRHYDNHQQQGAHAAVARCGLDYRLT